MRCCCRRSYKPYRWRCGVAGSGTGVRPVLENGVVKGVVKEDLGGVVGVSGGAVVGSNAHVNVDGAAAVPAWVDGVEGDLATGIGDLVAAHEFLTCCGYVAGAPSGIIGGFIRVDAGCATVPDVDVGAGEGRAASAGIDRGDGNGERNAGLDGAGGGIGSDVGPEELFVYPVRAFGDIGCGERAGCGGGFDGFVPGRDEAGSSGRFEDGSQGCSPVLFGVFH